MPIRDANDDDVPGILAIYNDVIATSTAVYREDQASSALPRMATFARGPATGSASSTPFTSARISADAE
jgi:L-amino acid N-acyltransferase YncA